jgi:hypothetical protein
MSNTKGQEAARDTFEKVGDDDQVVNVSGAPSPKTLRVRRPHTIAAPPPGQHVSHRTPVEIDAESGEKLDENLEKATMRAVRRQAVEQAVSATDSPSARAYLAHIFGVTVRRDRA